ncbi:hypothetical protein ACF0H5_019597 [Mactra antiquata]
MFRTFKRFSSSQVCRTMDSLHKTIENEVQEPLTGTVSKNGKVPDWVNGCLYRNGPGMYEVGEHKFLHWFDGLAMLQKFSIVNGSVTYQRKFLNTETYQQCKEKNRIVHYQFATPSSTDPCKNIFQRFLTKFEFSDNTLVHVFPVKEDLYATTETLYMNRINPDTLEVAEKINLEENVGATLATPHPHIDADGTMHNLGHCFQRGMFVELLRIPPREADSKLPKGEVVCKLNNPWSMSISYYHSFGMTENYYVFVEQPLLSNIPKLLIGRKLGNAFEQSLQYFPDMKTRFRIVDKKTGKELSKKIHYETDAFLLFHHINAYEEDGHIVLDLCCHKDKTIMDNMYMKKLSSPEAEQGFRDAGPPQVRRYVLPLNLQQEEIKKGENLVKLENTTATCRKDSEKSVHCEAERLTDAGMEFPQINYDKYNAKKYRYMYGVNFYKEGIPSQRLVKIDAVEKTYVEWKENYSFPSEPVFIPKPDAVDEDDGALVAAINHAGEQEGSNTCYLLFLDAKTMEEMARVEFKDIDRFPRDLHGAYKSNNSML